MTIRNTQLDNSIKKERKKYRYIYIVTKTLASFAFFPIHHIHEKNMYSHTLRKEDFIS